MEKVLSADLAGAEEIVAAAREADIALSVSLWRSDRGYTDQIAEMVRDGLVGTVTSARVRDGHPFALPTADNPDGILRPASTTCRQRREASSSICAPALCPCADHGAAGHRHGWIRPRDGTTDRRQRRSSDGLSDRCHRNRRDIRGESRDPVHDRDAWHRGLHPLFRARHRRVGRCANPRKGSRRLTRRCPSSGYRNTEDALKAWHEVEIAPDAPLAFDQWVEHVSQGTRAEATSSLPWSFRPSWRRRTSPQPNPGACSSNRRRVPPCD